MAEPLACDIVFNFDACSSRRDCDHDLERWWVPSFHKMTRARFHRTLADVVIAKLAERWPNGTAPNPAAGSSRSDTENAITKVNSVAQRVNLSDHYDQRDYLDGESISLVLEFFIVQMNRYS